MNDEDEDSEVEAPTVWDEVCTKLRNVEPVGGYSADWAEVSRRTKELRGWRCELCGFTAYHSAVIHTHHVDRDKPDNHPANLQVLCLACHQSKHGGGGGMGSGVPRAEREAMEAYRRSPAARVRLRDEPMKD